MLSKRIADIVARSHGGDGGNEPPHRPTIGTNCQRSRSRPPKPGAKIGKGGKVVRGATKNTKLRAERSDSGKPVSIRFEKNAEGMYEHVGPHAKWFSNLVGELLRTSIPMHHNSWRRVPATAKAHIDNQLHHFFDLGEHLAGPNGEDIVASIEAYLQKRYDDNRYKYKKKNFTQQGGVEKLDEIKEKRPENIADDVWAKYVENWSNPKNLKRAATNRQNRLANTSASLHGSHSLAVIRDNFLRTPSYSVDGRDLIDLYRHNHTRDGVFESPVSEARYNQMIRMRTESTSGGTTMPDLDIMRHVIGGKQRGHIPGIGPVLPGGGRQTTLSASRARDQASSSSLHETVQKQSQTIDMILGWARKQPGFPEELASQATTSGSQEASEGESRGIQDGSGASGGSAGEGSGPSEGSGAGEGSQE